MGKRILRAVIKAVALAAGMVFLFDNKLSGTAGDVLLGSIAVLFLCAFLWLAFGLGDDDTGDDDNSVASKKEGPDRPLGL
jgi:hypothetical protein